jgi:DNA polymerase III subunit delta'
MLFASIQGQESVVATLRQTLASNRLGHAYLFAGPAGVGKKRTALALAQILLCEDKPHAGCGLCSGCVSVAARTHPDLVMVAVAAGKRDVTIEQIRELQRLLGLRPVRGGKKVAILDDAHLLNPAAQSALLKILEEPPGDALLLLLTVNSATLSRPLLSRCQQVRFTALPLPVVEDLLVREHGKDPATAHALALYSRGSIGRAVALDPQVFTEERQYAVKEFQHLRGAPFTALTRLADWLVADRGKKAAASDQANEGRATGERLEIMLSWYEEILRYVLLGQAGVVRYQDCLPALAEAAAGLGVPDALRQLTLVYDTIQALGRNANRQLAVEDLLIQLSAPARAVG